MERINIKNTLRIVGAAAALVLLSSCSSEKEAASHVGETTAADVFDTGSVTAVAPGESRFINVVSTDSKSAKMFMGDIDMTDHQYQHGWADDKAPVVGTQPIRIDAHVALSGSKSDYIDNDAGCDTLRLDFEGVDESSAYIGALALSGDTDDTALVTWPRNADGTPSETVYACFAENNASDGVVLFLSDKPR
jgi:hypothetical protein